MSAEGASYRDAGVDYEALDSAKRLAMLGALSTSPLLGAPRRARRSTPPAASPRSCSSSAGGRSRSCSRGSARSRVIAPRGARAAGRQPLRRRRLRRGRRDPQRPLLRGRAAARRQRLLRHRRLALVRAPRARRTALLEGWRRACEDAGCVWGGGESPSLPGMLAAQEIELAGAAVGAVPEGVAPILGGELRATATRSCWSRSSGLHANGASLARLRRRAPAGGLRDAAPRRPPELRRGAARPVA